MPEQRSTTASRQARERAVTEPEPDKPATDNRYTIYWMCGCVDEVVILS